MFQAIPGKSVRKWLAAHRQVRDPLANRLSRIVGHRYARYLQEASGQLGVFADAMLEDLLQQPRQKT